MTVVPDLMTWMFKSS